MFSVKGSAQLWLSTALTFSIAFPIAANSAVRDVVINEIAWMGTSNSSFDEWIELKNTTGSVIDLSGWTLNSSDGTPSISLSGSIGPYQYFLLERTDDTSVPGVSADQVYTGAMENGGEYLELKDASNSLVDAVDDWHAGHSSTRKSMERVDINVAGTDSSNWVTASTSYSSGFGTPGVVNSSVDDGTGSDLGCNYPNQLEITSINIGQGDATLIVSPTKLLLADVGESYWNSHHDANKVAEVIHAQYGSECNTLDYVVISHIHLDHIGYLKADEVAGFLLNEFGNIHQEGENLSNPQFLAGFAYLVKHLGFTVGETIIRDYKNHNPNPPPSAGGSKTYRNWRAYFESPQGKSDFNPVTAVLGTSQIDLGTVNGNPIVSDIIQVDGLTPSNSINGCDPATYFGGAQYLLRGQRYNDPIPPSENDLSIAFVVSLGNFDVFIGGDTSGENYESQWGYRYHDTETCLAEDPIVQANYGGHLDVLRANHHGSSHSTNQAFIDAFEPTITIFSVGDNNNFGHVNEAVLDRTLSESVVNQNGQVFLTESGADASGPSDLCHTSDSSLCAVVTDGEFPATTESNETGDAGVFISVKPDGSTYTVDGQTGILTYTSR